MNTIKFNKHYIIIEKMVQQPIQDYMFVIYKPYNDIKEWKNFCSIMVLTNSIIIIKEGLKKKLYLYFYLYK